MQLHDASGAVVSTDALLTVIGHETPSEDMPANFRSLIDAARLATE
jgi:hypothetical protein